MVIPNCQTREHTVSSAMSILSVRPNKPKPAGRNFTSPSTEKASKTLCNVVKLNDSSLQEVFLLDLTVVIGKQNVLQRIMFAP